MGDLQGATSQVAAATGFSGVVRVDVAGRVELAEAYGLAERAWGLRNVLDTRFGIASGTKGLTALAVVSLVEDGLLDFGTPARELLGQDLPLIDDAVTVEHLLAHRSGIGDYIDEERGFDATEHVLPVPVHQLATTEQYLPVLGGHPAKFRPGERFAYCNSGYVVLALLIERVTGRTFHEVVEERVCRPAGMSDTAFLRSDELPGGVARGYLHRDGLRTNVLHLPVRGSGDGGIYSTVGDVHAFWTALFAGRIVPIEQVERMTRPRSEMPAMRYGLGFWLHPSRRAVILEGADAGVSFRSIHDPAAELTATVVSNTTDGAWPVARLLAERLVP